MADSFQNEVPAARVNIKLDLHTGNAKRKLNSPSSFLLLAITVTEKSNVRCPNGDKIDINKNNFNSVMAEFSPAVNLTVEDTLSGSGNEQNIALEFKSLKDFEPEQVAKNIPQLRVLLAMRNLLRDLKSNLLDNATFRRELENILKDPTLSSELRDELAKIAPQENV